ncbi:MAG: sulfite oxidase [Acidobacteriota bacterium]|nr:sulfite oxidase [Acidobacteriota bacterium]
MSDFGRGSTNDDRRNFLRRAAALPLIYGVRGGSVSLAKSIDSSASVINAPQQPAGLIIRQKQPENLEFPFSTLDSFLTPNNRFYVRSHFPVPRLDVAAWRLRVEGAVARPLELSLAELLAMPARTATATLECAGNSRIFLVPAVRGVQWEAGAVSNAAWMGVPLAEVLERAGVQPNAVEVVLEGADRGEIAEGPKPAGPINYARSLPLAKALEPSTLLAYRMNDQELPAAHGYPLRAVVSGWYGMASVKWLARIVVTERPFDGYYQTVDYSYWERQNGLPVLRALGEMQTKALIARPAMGEAVQASTAYRVHGAAWTGDAEVTKVEVSTDGGRGWADARLIDTPVRYAWRRWEYEWRTPPQTGRYTLMARATDARRRTQPLKHDPDYGTYAIRHILPTDVEVQ